MGASTFIPGLNPQHPHYLPGYSGHCPLLRFSMGQTYGQATGQLLQGAPGLAWPPARRTLLPPIRPPKSPETPKGSLPVRRGHERLSSSLVPGYTGFIPQAQFIFAKNCSQAWTEALSDFNQRSTRQGKQGRLKEAKGEKDPEQDQEPKLEVEKDPELGQKLEQVREGCWEQDYRGRGLGLGVTEEQHSYGTQGSVSAQGLTSSSVLFLSTSPHKASPYSMDDKDPQKFFMSGFTGYVPRSRFLFGSSFPVLTNLALQEFGQMRKHGSTKGVTRPPLSRIYPQNLGLLPHYGGYVPGYKFQFGRTYGHFTQDALGLSTIEKQLLA